MASIAANIVTSIPAANAPAGESTLASGGDGFAAMLDDVARNDKATLPASTVDAQASSNDTTTDPSATDAAAATPVSSDDSKSGATAPVADSVIAQMLAMTQASQPAQVPEAAVANDNTDAAPADPAPQAAADDSAPATCGSNRPAENDAPGTPAASDPTTAPGAQVASGAEPGVVPTDDAKVLDGKAAPGQRKAGEARTHISSDPGVRHTFRNSGAAITARESDPQPVAAGARTTGDDRQATSDAQTPVNNASVDVTPSTSTPTAPAAQAPDAASGAPIQMAMAAAEQPVASASPILTPGAIAKPAKTAATPAAGTSTKTQARTSAATALAAAGNAIARSFSSEPAIRANALPAHGTADSAKPGADGPPPTNPPAGAATPSSVAATPTDVPQTAVLSPATDASTNAAPAPAPASAPDPAANLAVTNAATTTGGSAAAAPAATPAHLAAQIQVSHQAPDVHALAVNIAAKSQDGLKHFDIRLDPVELGRVDVRLTVDDAGKAQATLTVEKPQTLELLQKDSSHLERALKDAGLDLTQNGLNFSLKGQQNQQQGADHSPFARGRSLSARAVAAAEAASPILSTNGISASDTRLDIRV